MRTGHWVAIDFVVAGFVTLISVASGWQGLALRGAVFPLALLLAAGVFFPIALRRRAPAIAFGALLILGVLLSGVAPAVPAIIFLTAAYVLYTVTVTSSRRSGAAALALVLALMVIVTSTTHERPRAQVGSELVPVALANVIAWMTGYSVRQRRLYVVRLQQQAASSAVADERLRIARELHDVVAHSMSVIAVQAGYGQYVIDVSPDGAKDALGAIQATSRDALDEMRRMLGVLRQQDVTLAPPGGYGPARDGGRAAAPAGLLVPGMTSAGDATTARRGEMSGQPWAGSAPLAPAPGLADLDRLIRRTCGAGVRVSLEVAGIARPVPAGIDLSAYRIIQEALTNVVKHAVTGAACTVGVRYGATGLDVRVADDGGRPPALPRFGAPATAIQVPADSTAAARIPAAVGVNPAAGAPAQAAVAPGSWPVNGWRLPGAPSASAGHGIIGMRERASLCGGEFTAGPLAEGGFQVTAWLPLPAPDGASGRPA